MITDRSTGSISGEFLSLTAALRYAENWVIDEGLFQGVATAGFSDK